MYTITQITNVHVLKGLTVILAIDRTFRPPSSYSCSQTIFLHTEGKNSLVNGLLTIFPSMYRKIIWKGEIPCSRPLQQLVIQTSTSKYRQKAEFYYR